MQCQAASLQLRTPTPPIRRGRPRCSRCGIRSTGARLGEDSLGGPSKDGVHPGEPLRVCMLWIHFISHLSQEAKRLFYQLVSVSHWVPLELPAEALVDSRVWEDSGQGTLPTVPLLARSIPFCGQSHWVPGMPHLPSAPAVPGMAAAPCCFLYPSATLLAPAPSW